MVHGVNKPPEGAEPISALSAPLPHPQIHGLAAPRTPKKQSLGSTNSLLITYLTSDDGSQLASSL